MSRRVAKPFKCPLRASLHAITAPPEPSRTMVRKYRLFVTAGVSVTPHPVHALTLDAEPGDGLRSGAATVVPKRNRAACAPVGAKTVETRRAIRSDAPSGPWHRMRHLQGRDHFDARTEEGGRSGATNIPLSGDRLAAGRREQIQYPFRGVTVAERLPPIAREPDHRRGGFHDPRRLRARQSVRAHLEGLRPLGVVPHGHARHPEDAGLFLEAPGIGEHERGLGVEREELEVRKRWEDAHPT